VPAPRVFLREPKSLLQANITIDHRSQITERERSQRQLEGEKREITETERRGKDIPCGTAQFRRSLSASGTTWAYTLLAWDQFIGSDYVGRVHIERKLARVPAPRVFPREPKNLLQANITIDHRSQITKGRKMEKGRKGITRGPAPRVFPREPNSLLQANIKTDHRS